MSTPQIRVAVIFGGRSSEHQISCVSAGGIIANLDPERYEVFPVGITEDGAWVAGPSAVAELAISGRSLPRVDASAAELTLTPSAVRAGQLLALDSSGADIPAVDVVFPVLHGPFGEDGTIQGLLELAGVPYVGPGVLASAAGMDKEFTKKLLAAEGIPVGRQVVLRPGEETLSQPQRAAIGLPAFVKPARGGSSIGITKIESWEQLDPAIAAAREHDPKVIVEAGIVGREIECGVLEFPDGSVRASVPAEIRVIRPADAPGADGAVVEHKFYDFEAKYLDNVTEFDVPAVIDPATLDQLRELAVKAFRALDAQGLARVDFFLTAEGPVINEVNTMPGFTPVSMFPRMWAASGVDYRTLLATLIDTAIARGTGLR